MKIMEAIGILKEYTEHKGDKWEVSMTNEDILEFNDIIKFLQRGEKFEQMWRILELEGYGSETFKIHLEEIKQKYFPKPCSNIKLLEQLKNEFVKSEHSYYMERFMETCIKLFKGKEGD